jgi:hypothetical protein
MSDVALAISQLTYFMPDSGDKPLVRRVYTSYILYEMLLTGEA